MKIAACVVFLLFCQHPYQPNLEEAKLTFLLCLLLSLSSNLFGVRHAKLSLVMFCCGGRWTWSSFVLKLLITIMLLILTWIISNGYISAQYYQRTSSLSLDNVIAFGLVFRRFVSCTGVHVGKKKWTHIVFHIQLKITQSVQLVHWWTGWLTLNWIMK